MNSITIALGSATTACIFIMSGIPEWVKKIIYPPQKPHEIYIHRRLKPFDCAFCLSFWLAIGSGIYFGKSIPEIIYIGSEAALLSLIIDRALDKLGIL